MFDLTEKMSSHMKKRRPTCEKILSDRKHWGLSLTELKSHNDFEISSDSSDKFYLRFIEVKNG